jgi:hypothetical protein
MPAAAHDEQVRALGGAEQHLGRMSLDHQRADRYFGLQPAHLVERFGEDALRLALQI